MSGSLNAATARGHRQHLLAVAPCPKNPAFPPKCERNFQVAPGETEARVEGSAGDSQGKEFPEPRVTRTQKSALNSDFFWKGGRAFPAAMGIPWECRCLGAGAGTSLVLTCDLASRCPISAAPLWPPEFPKFEPHSSQTEPGSKPGSQENPRLGGGEFFVVNFPAENRLPQKAEFVVGVFVFWRNIFALLR